MNIKNELQTSQGLMALLRNELLPNTNEMANLAMVEVQKITPHYITKDFVLNNFNNLIVELIKAETKIFEEIQKHVINEVFPFYLKNYRGDDRFPATEELIKELHLLYQGVKLNSYTFEEFIESVTKELSPVIDVISFSAKQSAKSRVGNSLENHLKKLFEIIGLPFDSQKQVSNQGAVLDFIIPSKRYFDIDPSNVINLECQTTLKDRFRLTLSKIATVGAKKYLVTATGKNLITDRDKQDLSLDKVREIIDENRVTLVVFDDVKTELIRKIKKELKLYENNTNRRNTLSKESLEKLLSLSERKICSFTELINREILAILRYWDIDM